MISPGASVTEGQPVMELETDKAVVEVPSSVSGTVKEIRVKEGQKVKVGQVIFTAKNGAAAKPKTAESKAPAKVPAEKPPTYAAKAPPPDSAEARPVATSSTSQSSAATVATEFRLPELGENIDQDDLVRLMISPAATVSD